MARRHRAGQLAAPCVKIWHQGRCVGRHPRSYGCLQEILDFEFYLDVPERKAVRAMTSGWTPADELRPAVAGVDGPPPGYLRTADLMAALSLASDLAVGLPAEHAVRSCYIAMHVADQMHLPAE